MSRICLDTDGELFQSTATLKVGFDYGLGAINSKGEDVSAVSGGLHGKKFDEIVLKKKSNTNLAGQEIGFTAPEFSRFDMTCQWSRYRN